MIDKVKYSTAASDFVFSAFQLLDCYKKDPHSSYVGTRSGIRLYGPFILQVTDKGRLVLNKICTRKEDDGEYLKVIGHSFNERYSQITYVGKLLAVYLEQLQLYYESEL
jgi:hypothetical protein